jgi:hypothetical protein
MTDPAAGPTGSEGPAEPVPQPGTPGSKDPGEDAGDDYEDDYDEFGGEA